MNEVAVHVYTVRADKGGCSGPVRGAATLALRGERYHGRAPVGRDQLQDVLAPSCERRPSLILEAVPLIDAHNAGAGARDVAEHRLDHLKARAEPL
jgi:hypothetical protein